MLPLHAGSAILMSMCSFCIGYGIGYLQQPKPKIVTITTPPPADGPSPVPFNPPNDDKS
jgi:hypothetical protein